MRLAYTSRMGHRANYVVVAGGKRELWYSHWTANSLTRDLFWGPQHALPFIRRQQPTEEWLDDLGRRAAPDPPQ